MLKVSRLQVFSALIAISAWMLLAHPYRGVRHDGALYFGQTLLHSTAPGLANDVFFIAGSQDRYSIYAHLMVPLYEHVGRSAAHVSVLLVTWALLAGAILALLKRFDSAKAFPLWGLIAFAIMSPIYGGGWVFSYGESFVTARNFAEPLLAWGLVALLAKRRLVSIALQVLGALFHPLMALPVMAVNWYYLIEADRRWLWILVTIPMALLASAIGMPPWNGLMRTYDPYWWSLVDTGNHHLMISNWNAVDALTVVFDLAVLFAVTRLRAVDDFTRLIYAVIATTVIFIGLSAVGVDFFKSVLLTQLQLWRAHWISHLFAMALSPWLLGALWRMGGLWKASACALGMALLNFHIGRDYGLAVLSLWGLSSLAAWRVQRVSDQTVWVACACISLGILSLSVEQLSGFLLEQAWKFPDATWHAQFIAFAPFPSIAAPCFAALLIIGGQRGGAWLALVLSVGLLLAALVSWDQRSDLARAIESPPESANSFASKIPAGATVFWPHELAPVWGLLGRASHYSQQQGAGVLFNRDTALIYGPRREIYRAMTEDQARCNMGAMLTRDRVALQACRMPSPDRLATLCGEHDAPDFLVVRERLKPEPLASWSPDVKRDLPQTYLLYACSQLTTQDR